MENGYKIREIAEEIGCSTDLVHKLISEQEDM